MAEIKIKLDALEQEILNKGLESVKNGRIDEIKAAESEGKTPFFFKKICRR